ncbi:MAG: hypothetical protein GY934_09005 [Gammaproteobacteria bacterium]|nr:hypothetical protein [Gammaproteobacteria bacterium]
MTLRDIINRSINAILDNRHPPTDDHQLHADLGLDSLDYVELVMLVEEDMEANFTNTGDIPEDLTVLQFEEKCQGWFDEYLVAKAK